MDLLDLCHILKRQNYLKGHLYNWAVANNLPNCDVLLKQQEKNVLSTFVRLLTNYYEISNPAVLNEVLLPYKNNSKIANLTAVRRISKNMQDLINFLRQLNTHLHPNCATHTEAETSLATTPVLRDNSVFQTDIIMASEIPFCCEEVIDATSNEDVPDSSPERSHKRLRAEEEKSPEDIVRNRLIPTPSTSVNVANLPLPEQLLPSRSFLLQHLRIKDIEELCHRPLQYHATKESHLNRWLKEVWESFVFNLPSDIIRSVFNTEHPVMQHQDIDIYNINLLKIISLLRVTGIISNDIKEMTTAILAVSDTNIQEQILKVTSGGQLVQILRTSLLRTDTDHNYSASQEQPTMLASEAPTAVPHTSGSDRDSIQEPDAILAGPARATEFNTPSSTPQVHDLMIVDLNKVGVSILKDVILNRNCVNNTAIFIDQAKQLLTAKLIDRPDIRLINLTRTLTTLGVLNVQTKKDRQLAQLKTRLLQSDDLPHLYDQLTGQLRTVRNESVRYIVHNITNMDRRNAQRLYVRIVTELEINHTRKKGDSFQQACKDLMLANLDNDAVFNLFAAESFPTEDSGDNEHIQYAAVPNQVTDHKEAITDVMKEFHSTGIYRVTDNPVIDACKRFHTKFQEQLQLPQEHCQNCQAQDLFLKVSEGLCSLCSGSKTRSRNFSAENSMDPGDQPPQLQGLTPAEIAAISLVLPVLTVYRMGDGMRMKGHSIAFPQDLQPTINSLPRLPADLSIVFISSPSPRSSQVLHVRKGRIVDALTWLKDHNPYYAHIHIDLEAVNSYPTDGAIDVPGYVLPESAHTTPNCGPTTSTDTAEHEESNQFMDTMRLSDHLGNAPQTDVIIAHLQSRLEQPAPGSTTENPLPWHPQGEPTGERAPGFWAKAFPHLFCYGLAGYNDLRPYKVTRPDWASHLMQHKSGRFASDIRFVFYLFSFLQKEKAWTIGNIYASKNAFTTKADLIQRLDDSGETLKELAKKIVKSSSQISGTNQYLKRLGSYAYSFINHNRHHTNDTENFNIFYTVSSADFHWPEFYKIFQEGRDHLSKVLVRKEEDIPDGADRHRYVTHAEDFLWRRRFLIEKSHEYDLYFRRKVNLLIEEVLKPVFGVKDHIIRWEYQSRGAIHAHILLYIPMGITEIERKRATKIPHTEEFLALRQSMQARVFNEGASVPVEYSDDLTAQEKAIYTEMKIIIETAFNIGITECHPSRSSNDWFIQDNGIITNPPSNSVLRQDFNHTLQDSQRNLTDIINKVGIHRCSQTYCRQPKTIITRNEETGEMETKEIATDCRFRYPRDLCGFEPVYIEDGLICTGAERIAEPAAPGELTHYGSTPIIKMLRNHKRCISYHPALLLLMPGNQDMQYILTLDQLIRYITKYITKPEVNSEAARNFQEELFNSLDDEDPVRKFCQKVIQHSTKGHDYTLAEVQLYLNRGEAILMSKQVVILPLLNDKQIDLDVADNEVILKTTLGEVYDDRMENRGYNALIQAYELAIREGYNAPCTRHPHFISLYEFASMYDRNWCPLPTFKVVHTLPPFKNRPKEDSAPEWFRKFLLCMIRAHVVPNVPRLEDLELLTNEELREIGDSFFKPGQHAATWAIELWNGQTEPVSRVDVLPLFAPRLDIEEEEEHAFVGHDLLEDVDAMGDGGPPEPVDADGGDEDFDDRYDEQQASVNFDIHADRQEMCPNWTREYPNRFRSEMSSREAQEQHQMDVLPHHQLNHKQGLAVQLLNTRVEELLSTGKQFFLEICGSAGTGKTTIMKRFKEDLRLRLVGHPTISVGQFLRFAAATGAAAKILPTPNSTLHKLVNLPINQSKKKALDDLTAGVLRTLQDNLEDVQLIIIDEKSFIGCRMIYDLNVRLQQIKCKEEPFGGISMVLLGDFKQLAPVNDLPLYLPSTAQMTSFQQMGHAVYSECFQDVIFLEENHRQANDPQFQGIIENFLNKGITLDDWYKLAQRDLQQLLPQERSDFERDAVYLCAYRKHYRNYNVEKILSLNNPRKIVHAVNNPEGGARFDSNQAGGLPNQLLLTRGMRVMLTANLDLSHGLSNGSTGTVIGIIYFDSGDRFPTVLVSFDDYTGDSCIPSHARVYPVGSIDRSWSERRTVYSREMLPLMPAYGFTIHKSQGQTLRKVIINLGPKDFAPGLTYTALTRARDLSSLAFHPMPDLDRFETVKRSTRFRQQIASDSVRKEKDLVTVGNL